jgi:hypothetical protein
VKKKEKKKKKREGKYEGSHMEWWKASKIRICLLLYFEGFLVFLNNGIKTIN